jgi:hypothetical protein
MQTAHIVTRPFDHSATKYPTYVIIIGYCTRSSTSGTILIIVCHAAHATYTPRDKQERFSIGYKDEDKTMKYLGFEFKHRQVNDSLQSKQGTDNLISHIKKLSSSEPG